MLKDCLDIFEQILKQEGDKLITDYHIPADGTYIIVDICNDGFKMREPFDIKLDKNSDKALETGDIDYNKAKMYDYYSKLVDMNKPMDTTKTIHSNNYLSFFIKKENIKNKLSDKIIDDFYNILKEPMKKYQSNKKSRDVYKMTEDEIGKVDEELLESIRSWIKGNIFKLNINTNKDYLKIFFRFEDEDKTIELYKKESKRYLIPNIYNKNEYNEIIDNKLFGFPNDNLGLNGKKPYLDNKTRKTKIPYLIDNEEVFLQKKFFDYLSGCAARKKYNIYIDNDEQKSKTRNTINQLENGKMLEKHDFTGIYLRIQKGKNLEIIDYDIISNYKYNLKKAFYYKSYIDIDLNFSKGENIEYYSKYYDKKDIQELLHEVYFSKFLKGNYFTDANEIKFNDNVKKRNLLMCRNSIFNWLYKGYFNDIEAVLNKATLEILKDSVVKGFNISAIHQFNLRWSFIEYFKGENKMADFLNSVKVNLKEKINYKSEQNEKLDTIENDMEYFFAVGQTAYYLLTLSKSSNKNQSLINPFLNAKNDEVIKTTLMRLYKNYNYSMSLNNKFKKLYSMVLGYRPESKIDQDILLAGFLSNNLVYEKDEKKGDA